MARIDLQGRWAFISGGSSGIGLAVAERAAAAGGHVLIFSIEADEALQSARRRVEAARRSPQQRVETLRLDVTDEPTLLGELGRACQRLGPPWLLVNSAGIGGAQYFEQATRASFERYLAINLIGARNVIAALLEALKPQGGHIVNVASLGGLIGIFGSSSYAASKFGLVGLSECLRAELKQYAINVCVLCPGAVDTPLWRQANVTRPPEQGALNRNAGTMSAEQVAEELFAALPRRRFLILPGRQAKLVHLINRLLPGLRERLSDRAVRRAQQAAGRDR